MEYEEVLLIGGPRDGHRMSVIAGIPTIQVAVLHGVPARPSDPRPQSEPITYTHPIYHRHPVHSSSGFVGAVYVAEGVDPMQALIAGYRRP